jgi:hypothetical protein
VLTACALAACDSRVGIEGTDYDTGGPATPAPASSTTTAPGPTPARTAELPVTVSLASPDSDAADALTRWATDLQQLSPAQLERKCWTMAPHNVESMYTDKQAILAALAQPGVDNGSTIVWKGPATGHDPITVVAQRTDIDAGYACPRVFPADTEAGFDDADARHTVRRYLDRAAGSPIDPADREATHPLVCTASWDPTGTGRSGTAPLANNPGKLTGVQSFVDSSITSKVLRDTYIAVTVQITTAAGGTQDRTFTLKSGEQGYCIGDIS